MIGHMATSNPPADLCLVGGANMTTKGLRVNATWPLALLLMLHERLSQPAVPSAYADPSRPADGSTPPPALIAIKNRTPTEEPLCKYTRPRPQLWCE